MDWDITIKSLSVLIGVAAFFRPELANAWYKKRAVINFIPNSKIEVGYLSFGPVISLEGSIFSDNSDIIIRNINTKIVRSSDKSEHTFSWLAFRPSQIERFVGLSDTKGIISPHSFHLEKSVGKFLNIIFSDSETLRNYRDEGIEYRVKWMSYFNETFKKTPTLSVQDIYEGFKAHNPQIHNNLQSKIRDNFYWQEGKYLCELTIESFSPKKDFKYTFDFQLTSNDKQNLLFDATDTNLKSICDIPSYFIGAQVDIINLNKTEEII